MHTKQEHEGLEALATVQDFDRRSGGRLERVIFNNRLLIVVLSVVVTLLLGWQASKLTINASFDKMIPQSHPYIRNYFEHRDSLRGLGNSVRVVVENTKGDVFDPAYLEVVQRINDAVFLIPGVERAWMKSLWTPLVRWTEVTEEGFAGGPVMPDNYDGSPASLAQLRANVYRANLVGDLVGNDLKSSTIFVPLLDFDPRTGKSLDYGDFSRALEHLRATHQDHKIRVHVTGFAKLVGDLIDGLQQVLWFFGASVAIALLLIYWHTRCWRLTLTLIFISVMGSVWLLGIMRVLGLALDPYSILVPFLIFAIGASHGAQKMNGIVQDVARGADKYVAARYTFRRLFTAGLTAVLCNVVGFAVLMIIDVPAIRELALMTCIGVAVLIFTKLILVPVLLSYAGVSPGAIAHRRRIAQRELPGAPAGLGILLLTRLTERRWATLVVVLAAILAGASIAISHNVKFGDLDPGAPELWPDSRYNRDVAYVNSNYSLSSDQFAVIVATPQDGCEKFDTLIEMDRLGQTLRKVEGVQSVVSLADAMRTTTAGLYEGSIKWATITRNPTLVREARDVVVTQRRDLTNTQCAVSPMLAYLQDHKAETLDRVVAAVATFAVEHDTADRKFLLAAGSAGIEAVTNIVVRESNKLMLLCLYSATALLCFWTFRSWRAVVVAMIPLLITSFLCEALMVGFGIGIKVATLPVIALGVGVGVDYALYLLSVQITRQRQGRTLRDAYGDALHFTGRIVALVGVTMAAGVITWAWSPIKFQANMGVLLMFMFLWNMVGALVLIPALSHFLLRDIGPKPSSTEVNEPEPEGAMHRSYTEARSSAMPGSMAPNSVVGVLEPSGPQPLRVLSRAQS